MTYQSQKQNIIIAALLLSLTFSSVNAQNAAQIAKVSHGESCVKCNLFQANLINKSLKYKNFSYSKLRQADLSASILNGSNFTSADLRDLNAYATLASNVNFSHAKMMNATFVGSYLKGANFTSAHLSGANFSGANLSNAKGLTQTQLNNACGDNDTILPHNLSIPQC